MAEVPFNPYEMHTPPSSDQDVEGDAFEERRDGASQPDLHCYERPDELELDECDDLDAPEYPRYLTKMLSTPAKRAKWNKVTIEEQSADLAHYFSELGIQQSVQVKICRAYANYLASLNPDNRVRRTIPKWKN